MFGRRREALPPLGAPRSSGLLVNMLRAGACLAILFFLAIKGIIGIGFLFVAVTVLGVLTSAAVWLHQRELRRLGREQELNARRFGQLALGCFVVAAVISLIAHLL